VRGFSGIRPHDIVEPNGLAIIGYANNVDTVREFAENLKKSGLFVDVYVDDEYFDVVSDAQLENARTTSPISGRRRGAQASSGGDESGRGGAALAGIAAPSARTPGRAGAEETGNEVFVFHVDVQIVGKPINRKSTQTAAAP
jgi:hypothetical protein